MKCSIISFLIFFSFLITAQLANAESVEGVVINIQNKKPIPYCRVFIGDNRALTDASGNFVMNVDLGTYNIRVQGYNTRRVTGANTKEKGVVRILPGRRHNILIHVSK